MLQVLLVDDGSMSEHVFEIIKSRFEVVAVKEAYQALETLRSSSGGFDVVISYVHYKRLKDTYQSHKRIADEFQHLPRVCSKCISEALKSVDHVEEGIMSVSDLILIHEWQSNTMDNLCMMEWTKELNFKFFAVVESLELIENATTPANILAHMITDEPKLTKNRISSHLQKYRDFKRKGERKNKLAKHYEEYQKLSNSQFLPEVMPSTAPELINFNGQLHDTLGTPQAWPISNLPLMLFWMKQIKAQIS
nr:two-component response regulator ARR10-like [Ipomoea batatas]